MSFWTGFTSGLAGSLDRGLQKSMNKRDEELSRAKQFWMERQASKRDKYEDEKKEQDKQAIAGYETLLVGMGGDATRAKAAFDSLVSRGGGISGVTDYLKKVRGRADQLGDYDMRPDFQDYKAGDTEYTGGTEGVRMPEFQGSRFDSSTMGLGSNPLDKLFGTSEENTDVARLQRQMDEQFGSTDRPDNAPAPSRAASFGRVDRSRLAAAESYAQEQKTIQQADAKVVREITAFGTNQKRLKALTGQIAKDEARANRGELNAQEQKTYNRNRDKFADAERKTKLAQEAENFVLDKQAKKLGITVQKLAIKKSKEEARFSDFEEMAVHYASKSAEEGISEQEKIDYTNLMNDAIEGAKEWNTKTATKGKEKSAFSNESRTNVFNAAIKKELAPYGLVNDLGLEIATEIEGNEPTYFAGMNRALMALNKQTAALQDPQFNSVIDSAVKTLIERVDIYKANPDNNLKDNKQPKSGDEAYSSTFTNTLEAGDVVRYTTPRGEVSMVWLGTKYFTQPIFETSTVNEDRL